MNRLTLQTPSRLHFGLLSWGPDRIRQFGGVGLMVTDPGLSISAKPGADWRADGPLRDRVLAAAERVVGHLAARGVLAPPLHFTIDQAPPEHIGLGVGTQAGMAVARIITGFAGVKHLGAADLAKLAGRGLRSGIGLHGFAAGGLIVDGGRGRSPDAPPAPLLARLIFPAAWSVLIVIPPDWTGLHGMPELRAFAQIPPLSETNVDRLCRAVLLELLPAVAEHNLAAFGTALTEIQTRIGEGFAPAQGGLFARPDLEQLASFLRAEGLAGVGQSSWGPTLYGFFVGSTDEKAAIRDHVLKQTGWSASSIFWTTASPDGVRITQD